MQMMSSLQRSLNCPHCYLSLDQRRYPTILTLADMEKIALNVRRYYEQKTPKGATIIFYRYGGEPAQMGLSYFTAAIELLNLVFRPSEFQAKHVVISSLLNIDEKSFDGGMRGTNYKKRWDGTVRDAVSSGLLVSSISVVNQIMIADAAGSTLDYLSDLGLRETRWLPFMLNEQNKSGAYSRFSPRMDDYSAFMIELGEKYLHRRKKNLPVPEIGQLRFILGQHDCQNLANIAGQTLFLLPNGDFVLPDYKDGYREFMQHFGNGLRDDFGAVLISKERLAYLRKQALRNWNADCLECDLGGQCIMEFWKDNLFGDDCFGAKRYAQWLNNPPEWLLPALPSTLLH